MIKKISNIATLNKETYKKNELPSFLNYLDTGNLTKDKVDEYKRLILGKDKIPSRAQRKVRTNTILYSTVRPNQEHFGFVENPIENLIVSTGFTTIDVNDENIDSKFLYFKLTQKHITSYLHTIGMNSVSSYPSISPNDIGSLKFDFPPLSTQKQIAKVLSDLDAKIEINNKINQQLEAMAKTLYDYWFVQFDFPDKNGKAYKSSGGKMVFNEELKREIPEGWEVDNLLSIANFQNGLACQKYRPINDDFLKVIKIKDMKEGFSDKTEKVRSDVPDKIKVFNGDILFSWSASLEVMQWSGGKGALNQHIFKVTSDDYPKSYYFFELLNYLQHFKMQAELRKTTMGHITQEHLKQSRITIPPIDLINKLDKVLKPILKKQVKLNEENQKLSELRDWLLPMLMNGQVTVANTSLRGTKQSYSETSQNTLGCVAEENEEYR